MLIVMAGLPGAGKSSLAGDLARGLGCPLLSVDPVEAAMWRAGIDRAQPTGLAAYVVVEALAAEQLALGLDVIVDAVNEVPEARQQWIDLAERCQVPLRFIEVRCGDEAEHRRRLASRVRTIEGMPEPSWQSVLARRAGFEQWDGERLVLDSLQARDFNTGRALRHVAAARLVGKSVRTSGDS